MKSLVRFIYNLVLVACLGTGRIAAQTLDPAFAPVSTFQTSAVYGMQEQPDGKIVVAGTFTRVNGRPAVGLARLNADGTLDEPFTTAAASGSPVEKLRRFANGQLLVTGSKALRMGGRRFNGVAKLDPDGTLTAGLDPGTGIPVLRRVVVE